MNTFIDLLFLVLATVAAVSAGLLLVDLWSAEQF
jgi:hypothetical protein